jgi:hypothetical protein
MVDALQWTQIVADGPGERTEFFNGAGSDSLLSGMPQLTSATTNAPTLMTGERTAQFGRAATSHRRVRRTP